MLFGFFKRLQRLKSDRRGSVAMQFALLALPMTVLAFGILDINRGSVQKRQLQDALDAATLAAARSTAITEAELQAVGMQALIAELAKVQGAQLSSATFALNGPTVVADARMTVPTLIAGLWMDDPNMTVATHTEVERTLNKLEVVLVLDNTGSMAWPLNSTQSKIDALREAATNFVDTLAAAASRSVEPNPVKIGLVPFSSTVRVGSVYQGAAWIDNQGVSPINNEPFLTLSGSAPAGPVSRFDLFAAVKTSWAGCVESRMQPYDVQDTAPTAATPGTLVTPFFAVDEPDTNSAYKNNYLNDGTTSSNWKIRQGNTAKYTAVKLTGGRGPNKGCGMAPLMRMTNNWAALKGAIAGMVADGNTNIPVGMMWGWHVLSPNAPFADGVSYAAAKTGLPRTTKIAVLMTDGDNVFGGSEYGNNNYSAYEGYAYGWQDRLKIGAGVIDADVRAQAMDDRLALLCSNMKQDDKVVIYTIGVGVSERARSLLTACATNPDMYYDVTSAGSMNAAFHAIAGSIDNLRIAK